MKTGLLILSLGGILMISCKNNENQEAKKSESVVQSQQPEDEEEIPTWSAFVLQTVARVETGYHRHYSEQLQGVWVQLAGVVSGVYTAWVRKWGFRR